MDCYEPGRIELGGVTITWNQAFEVPVGDHPLAPELHVTLCPIVYHYGNFALRIPKGFLFDGASIPWIFRWLPGFAAHDWHFLASLPHDFVCEHPEILPRPVGDGIFVSVMLALAAYRCAEAESTWELISRKAQALVMYVAVSGYTICRAFSGATIQT